MKARLINFITRIKKDPFLRWIIKAESALTGRFFFYLLVLRIIIINLIGKVLSEPFTLALAFWFFFNLYQVMLSTGTVKKIFVPVLLAITGTGITAIPIYLPDFISLVLPARYTIFDQTVLNMLDFFKFFPLIFIIIISLFLVIFIITTLIFSFKKSNISQDFDPIAQDSGKGFGRIEYLRNNILLMLIGCFLIILLTLLFSIIVNISKSEFISIDNIFSILWKELIYRYLMILLICGLSLIGIIFKIKRIQNAGWSPWWIIILWICSGAIIFNNWHVQLILTSYAARTGGYTMSILWSQFINPFIGRILMFPFAIGILGYLMLYLLPGKKDNK